MDNIQRWVASQEEKLSVGGGSVGGAPLEFVFFFFFNFLFSLFTVYFLCVWLCVCVCVYTYVRTCVRRCVRRCVRALYPLCPQSPGKSVGFLGAGVTGGCELPSVGTEKCTWVFWKQK